MSNYLILHDNHLSIIPEGKVLFKTTTFHLFLQGFNGSAHLTSPFLDWNGGDNKILINGVVIRPRRGYGRAQDFYIFFIRNAFRSFIDIYRILNDYDAIMIAGPCCSAPFAHLAAWFLRKPVVGYVIANNRAVVKSSNEYIGVKRWIANAVAHWEWAAMARLARRHHVIALGNELYELLKPYGPHVSFGFTSLIREDQIIHEKVFHADNTLSLLTVGRVSQEKGIEWALRALKLLKEKGISATYTVVGDGSELKRLSLLVDELGLASEVHFVGVKPFSELPKYYQTADIFILPSYSEGIPKVLLEAMSARVAVVATRVGGNGWVLGEGQRGYLVPPKDEVSIAGAIIACMEHSIEREIKLNNATNFCINNTMEAMAAKIQEVIELEINSTSKS